MKALHSGVVTKRKAPHAIRTIICLVSLLERVVL